MKKVLFLSPLPPPHYGSAMSSEMCLNILKDSKCFEVRNIKLNYSRDMNDVGRINFDKIRGIFHVKKRIREEIEAFKPDIIYFVPATYSLGLLRDWFFVREIKKHWKGKILFHIRSRILDKTWNSFFGKRLLKGMYKGNKAILLGKELTNDLRGIIPKKDIHILPNAIKNEVSESELKKIIRERKKNKQFNILFLSNMDRSKGWPKLLEACKILNEKKFNFRCDFVGAWQSEKDEKYFWSFIEDNGLKGKVFAHGKKTGKDKNEFLRKADLLVFPTEKEAFGKVLLEAYMFSIPVIGNFEGSIPSIIEDGRTGFLLKKNTGEEIASRILEGTDWEKMGIAGRKKFLKEFEVGEYGERFRGIVQDLD